MRAVKSEEDIKDRSSKGGYLQGRILSAGNIGIYVKQKLSLDSMSTPVVMANLTKIRQNQTIEKSNKKKDIFRNKSKKDVTTDPLTIGDNFQAFSPYESTIKEGRELVRPSTAGRNKNHVKELLSNGRENCPQNGELCKRCSTPAEHKPVEKFDEGFYDDEHSAKINIIEEVKELIRKGEAQKSETSDDLQNDLIYKSSSSCDKPKKRIWVAVLVWIFTFTGALACYFALFVYTYKYEPYYSKAIELLGIKEELPPPPPTMKDEIFKMFEHMSKKLYNVHLSLVEIVSLPFKNKS